MLYRTTKAPECGDCVFEGCPPMTTPQLLSSNAVSCLLFYLQLLAWCSLTSLGISLKTYHRHGSIINCISLISTPFLPSCINHPPAALCSRRSIVILPLKSTIPHLFNSKMMWCLVCYFSLQLLAWCSPTSLVASLRMSFRLFSMIGWWQKAAYSLSLQHSVRCVLAARGVCQVSILLLLLSSFYNLLHGLHN